MKETDIKAYVHLILFLIVVIAGLSFMAYKVAQAPNELMINQGLNASGRATHMLGLKFIPACEPTFGNATCGYDMLFIMLVLLLVLLFWLLLLFIWEFITGRNKDKGVCIHAKH